MIRPRESLRLDIDTCFTPAILTTKSTQESVRPKTTTTISTSIALSVSLPVTSPVTLSVPEPIQTITISQPNSCSTMSMGLEQLRSFNGKESPITRIGQFDAWRILKRRWQ